VSIEQVCVYLVDWFGLLIIHEKQINFRSCQWRSKWNLTVGIVPQLHFVRSKRIRLIEGDTRAIFVIMLAVILENLSNLILT